jgi:arsenate reductase (thioredoxin)
MTTLFRLRHHTWIVAVLPTIVLCSGGRALAQTAAAQPAPKESARATRPTVLFMCPHGAAKSVLASAYFQRIAKERGLNVRVEAAGTEPQPSVSTVVKDHLEQQGYTVPVTKPRAVTKQDLQEADVVISMGCDLTGLPGRPRRLEKWDDVPTPSEDLQGADETIRRRVLALVEELLAHQKK